MKKLILKILPDKLAVCRLNSEAQFPVWLPTKAGFISFTATHEETSVVCREDVIPSDYPTEKNFRALKIQGPLDFDQVGILTSLLQPLAAAGISVFTISTFDTDYILVKQEKIEKAVEVLSAVADIRNI